MVAPRISSRAKLVLTERLLGATDVVECATAAVEWLYGNLLVERAIVGVVGRGELRCRIAASIGVRGATVGDWAEQDGDRLAVALGASEPIAFTRSSGDAPRTAIGTATFQAVPLRARSAPRDLATGLLLVAARGGEVRPEVSWAGSVLADAMALARGPELARAAVLEELSHDLRSPLHAVLGYSSMLLAGVGGDLASGQRSKVERIEANGRALLQRLDHRVRR